jgi:hypothetical protein
MVTRDLDAERKSALEERLEKADFFSLPSELPMESVGADQFTYSVTVSGARGSHTVSYRDSGPGSSTQPIGDIVEMVLATRPG